MILNGTHLKSTSSRLLRYYYQQAVSGAGRLRQALENRRGAHAKRHHRRGWRQSPRQLPREPRRAHDSGISEEKAAEQDMLQAVTSAQRHPYLLLLDSKPSVVGDRLQARAAAAAGRTGEGSGDCGGWWQGSGGGGHARRGEREMGS